MSDIKYTYTTVSNPQWLNSTQTQIGLYVNFDHLAEESVFFTADPNDIEPHGVELYNRAVAGDFGTIASYSPEPDLTGDDAMVYVRRKRDTLLTQSDISVLPDVWQNMTTDQQTAWSTYRQALRDLPANYSNPTVSWNEGLEDVSYIGYTTFSNVTWPTKPE